MRMDVTAAPSRDDSRTRRRAVAKRHAIPVLKRTNNKLAVITSLCLALDLRHNHVCNSSHGSPSLVEATNSLMQPNKLPVDPIKPKT